MSQPRALKLEAETVVTLAATLFSAVLLILTAVQAGPLWRDELNTANLAQMPTVHDIWQYSACESFPPLYPLLLRTCDWLGLTGSDIGIRLLGLYVGFLMLGSWWLCARWLGSRAPILSVALLGSLPAFVYIIGANRAYGLASALLVLSFGALWRMIEKPSRGRVITAAILCLIFVHTVYYDAVLLAGMMAGAGLVTLRRRRWKTLGMLIVIGAVCAVSTLIYLPIIHQGSAYVAAGKWPYFSLETLWLRLTNAVTARSSGEVSLTDAELLARPEIWIWMALLVGGLAAAAAAQFSRPSPDTPTETPDTDNRRRADLAVFCSVSMVIGVFGMMAFLYRLQFYTQKWYYLEMLCLCAMALDGLLGAVWSRRLWGELLRIGFLLVMISCYALPGWQEAHTRRTNADLVAAVLEQHAATNDFIVVQTAWEGISFYHYYHGATPWVTVPPMDSHLVHRNDLMSDCMNHPDLMTPVLQTITNTLHEGHSVWLVGNMMPARPEGLHPTPQSAWLGTYIIYWTAQISATVLDHALAEQPLDISAGGPVCTLENFPLVRFAGYTDARTNAPSTREAARTASIPGE